MKEAKFIKKCCCGNDITTHNEYNHLHCEEDKRIEDYEKETYPPLKGFTKNPDNGLNIIHNQHRIYDLLIKVHKKLRNDI